MTWTVALFRLLVLALGVGLTLPLPLQGASLRINEESIVPLQEATKIPVFRRLSRIGLRMPRFSEAGLSKNQTRRWTRAFRLRERWQRSAADQSNSEVKAETFNEYKRSNEELAADCISTSPTGELLYACIILELDALQFGAGKPNYATLFAGLPKKVKAEANAEVSQLLSYLLGVLYEETSNITQAERYYRSAVEMVESALVPELYFRLGRIYLFHNDKVRAIRAFLRVTHGEFFADGLAKLAWTQKQVGKCRDVMKTAARFRDEVVAEDSIDRYLVGIEELQLECVRDGIRLEDVKDLDPKGFQAIEDGLNQLQRVLSSRGERANFLQAVASCYSSSRVADSVGYDVRLRIGGTCAAPVFTPFADPLLLRDIKEALQIVRAKTDGEKESEAEIDLELALDLLTEFNIDPKEPFEETHLVESVILDSVQVMQNCVSQKLDLIDARAALSGTIWLRRSSF